MSGQFVECSYSSVITRVHLPSSSFQVYDSPSVGYSSSVSKKNNQVKFLSSYEGYAMITIPEPPEPLLASGIYGGDPPCVDPPPPPLPVF